MILNSEKSCHPEAKPKDLELRLAMFASRKNLSSAGAANRHQRIVL